MEKNEDIEKERQLIRWKKMRILKKKGTWFDGRKWGYWERKEPDLMEENEFIEKKGSRSDGRKWGNLKKGSWSDGRKWGYWKRKKRELMEEN